MQNPSTAPSTLSNVASNTAPNTPAKTVGSTSTARLGSCYEGRYWDLASASNLLVYDSTSKELSRHFQVRKDVPCDCGNYRCNGTRQIVERVLTGQPKRPLPSTTVLVDGIHKSYGSAPNMGCDPEFFLNRAGDFVPAFDHLMDKHTASANYPFWDGFQAEIRPNAYHCHAILAQNIATCLKNLPEKLQIRPVAVQQIPEAMLRLASDAHVELGCDASRNAYSMHGLCVREPRKLRYRFAGGHLHFSLTTQERNDPALIRHLVKTLDAYVGVPSVALAQNFDHRIRRRYYGLAGEFRLPSHGLEWRVLSNFWLMHPRVMMLVTDLARHALNIGRSQVRRTFVGSERLVRDTINYTDVRSAKELVNLNREFYSAWSQLLYGTDKPFFEAIRGGVDRVVKNWGRDVRKSWDWPNPGSWQASPKWADV